MLLLIFLIEHILIKHIINYNPDSNTCAQTVYKLMPLYKITKFDEVQLMTPTALLMLIYAVSVAIGCLPIDRDPLMLNIAERTMLKDSFVLSQFVTTLNS